MAEFGAHLTSTQTSNRPSIFEVLAQESLMSSVRPALKYATKIVAESRPEQYGWLLRFYDELYTVFDLILQNYYLRHHSASFSENFYGIKRACAQTTSNTGHLPHHEHRISLLTLVMVPYIKQKLESWYERLLQSRSNQSPTGSLSQDLSQKLCRLFVLVYPYTHMMWEGTALAYQLAYIFGRCPWHSPLLQAVGVELQNNMEEDGVWDETEHIQPIWNQASLSEKVKLISKKALSTTGLVLSTSMSVGVFFLQFLDWWYASDTTAPSLVALPIPDPPKVSDLHQSADVLMCPLCERIRTNDTALSVSGLSEKVKLISKKALTTTGLVLSSSMSVGVFFLQFLDWWYASDTTAPSLVALPIPDPPKVSDLHQSADVLMCPLCERVRTNDTALSVSGYVFCYLCIHGYIKQHGCCPITGYPARSEHLVKLYLPDS